MRQLNIIKALKEFIDYPFNANNFLLILSHRLIKNKIWYNFNGCYMMIDRDDADTFYVILRETIEYYFEMELNDDWYLDLISEL